MTVTPATAAVLAGAQLQFTAAVTNAADAPVIWAASAGSITAAGLFTAPSAAATVTVTATSTADPTKSASATVTVRQVDAARSSLSATPSSLPADGMAAATVSVLLRDTDGSPLPGVDVLFSVSGTGNALSAAQGVTSADGIATVTLSSTVAGWRTLSASSNGVLLQDSPSVEFYAPTAVTVSPPTAAVLAGAQLQFTASVTNAADASVSWTSSAGSITPTGLFTAPAAAATVTVTATSIADPTKFASATVTVRQVDAVRSSLSATPTSLPADGMAAANVSAVLRDTDGNPLPGVVVLFFVSGAGNTLSASQGVTSADGTATVTLTSTVAGWRTLSASSNGVLLQDSPSVEFFPWIDVDGVVVQDFVPLADIVVAAGTAGSWTWRSTTDAVGRFSLGHVRLPYDLVAVHPDGTAAVLHAGLSRADPTVSFEYVRYTSTVENAQATATVTCTTGCSPGFGTVFADAGSGTMTWFTSLGTTPLTVGWVGGSSAVARLGALFTDGYLPPTNWWYATSLLPVAAGETLGATLDLAPASSPPLTVTVSPATGIAPRSVSLQVRLGNWDILYNWWQQDWGVASTSGQVTLTLPTGTGISPRVVVGGEVASGSSAVWWEGSPSEATSIVLELPARPVQVAPADGAADVTPGTEFSWSSAPGNASALYVSCGAGRLTAYTDGSVLVLPDLGELGFSWSPGTACTWTMASGPPLDVNDAASARGPRSGVRSAAFSAPRAFTLR